MNNETIKENPVIRLKFVSKEPSSLEELHFHIERGARFICYQYCISILFAVTLRRYSPAILVASDSDTEAICRKYNWLSLLFGWWGVPWGPIYTLRSLSLNKMGGIDFTEDILLNIDKDSLIKREVELKATSQLFCHPDRWNIKAYNKCLKPLLNEKHVKSVVVGVFINTTAPIQTIGIETTSEFYERYSEMAKKNLYREFNKHVVFQFLNIAEETEQNLALRKQGIRII